MTLFALGRASSRWRALLCESAHLLVRDGTIAWNPATHIWREQGGAPVPLGAEVDDLGDTMRVLLFLPGEEGVLRVQMNLDREGRLAGLLFQGSAPRTRKGEALGRGGKQPGLSKGALQGRARSTRSVSLTGRRIA